MAGGNQIVMDLLIDIADVAAHTQPCSIRQFLHRLEAELELVRIAFCFPVAGIMHAEPILRSSVAALAADAKITNEELTLRPAVGIHRVAVQTKLILLGISLLHA